MFHYEWLERCLLHSIFRMIALLQAEDIVRAAVPRASR
jgi:hypothetical protein